jgi:hypothetical protein
MRRIIMLSLVGVVVAAALLFTPRSRDVAAQAGPDDIEQILLEIDGIPVATGVVAVSGLAIHNEISAIRDPNGNIVGEVVKPTSPAEPTFVLEPGRLADEIWEWYTKVQAGEGSNRSMSVVFLSNREEVFRYNLIRALPKAWRGFRQVGPGAVVAREEVTFYCRALDRP